MRSAATLQEGDTIHAAFSSMGARTVLATLRVSHPHCPVPSFVHPGYLQKPGISRSNMDHLFPQPLSTIRVAEKDLWVQRSFLLAGSPSAGGDSYRRSSRAIGRSLDDVNPIMPHTSCVALRKSLPISVEVTDFAPGS